MQTKQENELQIKNDIGTAGYARTVGEDGKSYRTGISALVSGAIGDDIEQLENDVEALQTTVGEHTTDIQNNSDDISDLQTLTSGHTTSIGNLQTAVGTNTEDITDLKEDFETLETQLDETTTLALAALPQETIENVAIASFDDGGDGVPVKELKVAIEPIQSGSGDPSPTNVRPISGRDSVTVARTGVNVWDEEWESGRLDLDNGAEVSDSTKIRMKNYVPVTPNTTYYKKSPVAFWNVYFDANKNYIGYGDAGINRTFTTPNNAYYMRSGFESAYGTTYTHDISINYPSTDHDYHSGADNASYPIPLSSTIYGGTLDVGTGVLTVTHGFIESYNGETLPSTWISDRDVYAEGTTPTTGAEVVYALATPTTVQLTPTQVTTLLKDNNIFADSGNIVKLIYRADLGAYIQNLINA